MDSVVNEELRREVVIEYRPDIDGLRAVAVGFVILFHAFARVAGGGFVGVDVFFVISGFLITSIIHKQSVEGRFSFVAFYCKRVRRIFPALLVVTLVTFIVGYLVLPPKEMQSLGLGLMGTAGFVQNFVLLSESGYFDISSHGKPLLHIWSLGIEEQYYIFWPVVLFFAIKVGLNLKALLIALIVLSFANGLITLNEWPDLGFYSPLARAWQLLAGSLLAVWLHTGPAHPLYHWPARYIEPLLQRILWDRSVPARGHLVHDLASVLGLGLLAYAIWWYDDKTTYPGIRAVVPVMAAVFLILSRKSLFNRYILSSRLFVGVGLISYPLYLWHFPLLANAHVLLPEGIPWRIRLVLVLLAVLLAWLTYRFVELPVHKRPATPVAMAPFAAGMVVIGGIGALAWATGGMPFRIPAEVRAFYITGEETSIFWRRGECLLLPEQGSTDFASDCLPPSGASPRIALWGDSYAAAIAQGFVNLADEYGYKAGWVTSSACPPLIGYVLPERRFCKENNDWVMAEFEKNPPDIVILHSTWMQGATDIEQGLPATVSRLRAAGVGKIILLGIVNSWKGEGLPANFLDYYSLHWPHSLMPARTFFRSTYDWTKARDNYLRELAENLDVRYVSTLDAMCNETGCLARVGDKDQYLTAIDNGHLTVPAATVVVRELMPQILEGW